MRRINNEKGYALVTVVLISLLFMSLAIMLMSITFNGMNKNKVRDEYVQASEISDKGLNHLTAQINKEIEDLLNEYLQGLEDGDGMTEEEFEQLLEDVLSQYLCSDDGRLKHSSGSAGEYEICIEGWENSEGSLGKVLKEVTFKSVGSLNKRDKTTHSVVRIGTDQLQENEVTEETPGGKLDIVLAIDVSDSMQYLGRIDALRDAATDFVDEIITPKHDIDLSIVTFHDYPDLVAESLNHKDKRKLLSAVNLGYKDLGPGTNIQGGLYFARRLLETSEADGKITILFSDGSPTAGYDAKRVVEHDWPTMRFPEFDPQYTFNARVTESNYGLDFEKNTGVTSKDYFDLRIPRTNYYQDYAAVLTTISEAHLLMEDDVDLYAISLGLHSGEYHGIYTMEQSHNKGYYAVEDEAGDELKKVFKEIGDKAIDKLEQINKGKMINKVAPPKLIDRK